jgi:phosphate:Na+ symporter
MGTEILQAIGGLGIFLLGMVVMTDGLRMLTGEALQQALARFTRSPTSGAVTGAATTAIIQSSSATSVAAIGFVNAGLLTFPQALGIIFGANIGTTITGWLVALVGFKLDLGTLVMPLALLGVLVYLFAKSRARHAGIALAGFALIFVGIEILQGGMAGLEGTVTPDTLPEDTWSGRLLLVGIGMLITLVTQSSSAGVATAITAVNVGAISFPQAAAMVIGFDVGSAFTALIAVIGGSVPARRTGFSHVIYNFMTGTGAYFLLTFYVWALASFLPESIQTDPELALVGFHTLFNSLGVIIVLPFANAFANMIIRMVPDRGPILTRRLDETLVPQPSIAMQAVDRTLREIIEQISKILRRLLVNANDLQAPPAELDSVDKALQELHIYLDKLVTSSNQANVHRQHVSALHIRDHLARIVRRCQAIDIIETIRSDEDLLKIAKHVVETVDHLQISLAQSGASIPINEIKRAWSEAEKRNGPYRAAIFAHIADDNITREEANSRLSGIRWLRRISLHLWRIAHHMNILSEADLSKAIRQKQA